MSDLDKNIELLNEMKANCIKAISGKGMYFDEKAEQKAQAIENVLSELETWKKIAKKLAEQVKRDTVFYDTEGISSCDLSEEKYCKCSKHNNGANCIKCIIDWARKEVEKDEL